MNNSVFGKTMDSIRKLKRYKTYNSRARRNYVMFEPNIMQQSFSKKSISSRNEKTSSIYE